MTDKEELFQLYKVLEKNGIHIDQVDYDDQGRELFRWFISLDDGRNVEMTGVEYWHTRSQALDAALSWMLWRKERSGGIGP